MQLDLTVHIGLPRAASTFLQERVFAQLKSVHYIGKTRQDYPPWLKEWHYSSDLAFQKQSAWIRRQIEALSREDKPNILSSEMFSMWGNQASTQAARLHAIAPEAKISITLREPLDRMRSFYKAIVQHNDVWHPMESLIDWQKLPFVFYKRLPICLADYCYNDLIEAYERFFPKERICVQTYEDMKADFEGFLTELSHFAGFDEDFAPIVQQSTIRENHSYSDQQIRKQLQKNAMKAIHSARSVSNEIMIRRKADNDLPEWELSDQTRQKIVGYLRGKADIYYPDIKECHPTTQVEAPELQDAPYQPEVMR